MQSVILNMTDEMTAATIERTIDIANAMSSGPECWELRSEQDQRKSLERWISERGNEQHNTILTLNSWAFA